jgi:hypothetical protein
MNWQVRLVGCALFVTLSLSLAGAQHGGNVMPPQATPKGYSLDHMAKETALFGFNHFDIKFYPETPFQILFPDTSKTQFVDATCPNGSSGVRLVDVNSFIVRAGTRYFMLISAFDDAQPVGVFPTEKSQIEAYVFGPDGWGAQDFKLTVDGKTTPVGPEYWVGPIEQSNPHLPDGGTHFVSGGVFLTPLTPGAHTVRMTGQFTGSALFGFLGVNCWQHDGTWLVRVLPSSPD